MVAPCDTLDHVVRVHNVTSTSRSAAPIVDPITGRDIAESNPFKHPMPIEREPGYRPAPVRAKPPTFVTKKNKQGKEVQIPVEAPYHYDPVTGQRDYVDRRPLGRRIASDKDGNPLTFATKPGEVAVPKRTARTALADMADYDDDDPASLMERK
jgi:hypothetical protein